MAGTIIADTIQSAGSFISLNVGNVTVITANSSGLTLLPSSNVNVNLSSGGATLTVANLNSTTLTVTGNTTIDSGTFFVDSVGNKVGINTTSPNAPLQIAATSGLSPQIILGQTSSYRLDIGYNNSSEYGWLQSRAATASVYDDIVLNPLGGGVMIGTTSPANGVSGGGTNALTLKALDSSGTGPSATWGVGPTTSYGNFYIVKTSGTGAYISDGGNSWTTYSDERHKTDLEPITNAMSKTKQLRSVIGRYLTDEPGTKRSFLIAQDVDNVLPEAVDKSDPNKWGLSYTDVIPLMVATINELIDELEVAKQEIQDLKGNK